MSVRASQYACHLPHAHTRSASRIRQPCGSICQFRFRRLPARNVAAAHFGRHRLYHSRGYTSRPHCAERIFRAERHHPYIYDDTGGTFICQRHRQPLTEILHYRWRKTCRCHPAALFAGERLWPLGKHLLCNRICREGETAEHPHRQGSRQYASLHRGCPWAQITRRRIWRTVGQWPSGRSRLSEPSREDSRSVRPDTLGTLLPHRRHCALPA